MTLLNMRSLKRHHLDVRNDLKLVQSDMMPFTETRLKQMENTTSIEDVFSEFQTIFHNESNDFLSLSN